ncbi:MAG: HAMP domain-containing sensor histidine kinase [Arenimonas sp.]
MNKPSEHVRWHQRLYVRIYLALLVSLAIMGALFVLWHAYDVPALLGHSGPPKFFVGLVILALTVAIGAYPVVRRLTRRLEQLQISVDALGSGQLSTRVAVEGKDEVASLANSFNRSAARIEALLESQKLLLSNASHELRSPLARMRMAVELMQDRATPEIRRELTRNMAELDQLIDEILLASRLDAIADTTITREQLDLTALVAEECATFDAQLEAPIVSLEGDARLLKRMVRNLLENAQRYGEGTPIIVRLCINTEQSIQLDVIDSGAGIPIDKRENIFEPFYRLPGASEQDGGVGLGLSLVRQIASAHGGNVQYVSPESGGSCFRVVLP